MKKFYILIVCFFIANALLAQKLPFQGRLLDNGKPYNGTATIEFSISDPAWTETMNNISVQDGYYSVVLGETNPLPDTLFQNSTEVLLNITVNSEALSQVTLYAPFVNPNLSGGAYNINNSDGDLRGEFNYYSPNDAGSVVLYGANDSTKVILGTRSQGYEGALYLYDSTRHQHVRIEARNTGGRLQLTKIDDAGIFKSAIVATPFGDGNNVDLQLHGSNPAGDGTSFLAELYTFDRDIQQNIHSNGYRKGGLDLYDNEGRRLVAVTSNRDESGTDPTGASGYINLMGTNTPNVEIGGTFWDNNDLGWLQLLGQNDDGGSWFSSNLVMAATDIAGNSGAAISMYNTQNGGSRIETILLNTTDGSGQSGLIGINDAAGTRQITLDGGTGEVNAQILRSVDGTVQSSDKRLKSNIQSLNNALENTLLLRGVSYKWKDANKSQRTQIGVIAQELDEVYPELVHTNENGMKAVNYAQMNAILIEAIKELNAKVEKLESENSSLKASLSEIETLRKEMDQLMRMLGNSKAASK